MKPYAKITAALLAATVCLSINAGNVLAVNNSNDFTGNADTDIIRGDVNSDGKFNVADIVTFQKWLLGCSDVELKNWKAADLYEDNCLDVFDLCLMRQSLITQNTQIERPLLTIVEYDEYEKYLNDNNLSDKIVVYNDIKQFGEFKHFIVLSNSNAGDYSKIMYALVDNSEYEISLTISETAKKKVNESDKISADEINLSDMRTTKSEDTSGSFTLGDRSYNYVNGKLNTITWVEGKFTYVLSGTSMLYDYPIESDTYTSNMLKPNSNEEIEQPPVERPLLTIEEYDEYEKYLNDNNLNDKIVVYNDIKQFGEFKHFIVLSDSNSGDYSKIMYALVDNSEYETSLYINKAVKEENSAPVEISANEINLSDMRTTKSADTSGSFTLDNKSYNYVKGKLNTITWTEGSFTYILSGTSMLYDYPTVTNTYTSKLLFNN